MTENHEKELFNILGRLINGVSEVQSEIREIKATLAQHSSVLTEHSAKHDEHSRNFGRIDSKARPHRPSRDRKEQTPHREVSSGREPVEELGRNIH
jgi:hypothetical protein